MEERARRRSSSVGRRSRESARWISPSRVPSSLAIGRPSRAACKWNRKRPCPETAARLAPLTRRGPGPIRITPRTTWRRAFERERNERLRSASRGARAAGRNRAPSLGRSSWRNRAGGPSPARSMADRRLPGGGARRGRDGSLQALRKGLARREGRPVFLGRFPGSRTHPRGTAPAALYLRVLRDKEYVVDSYRMFGAARRGDPCFPLEPEAISELVLETVRFVLELDSRDTRLGKCQYLGG